MGDPNGIAEASKVVSVEPTSGCDPSGIGESGGEDSRDVAALNPWLMAVKPTA